jgi:hypothetical protein
MVSSFEDLIKTSPSVKMDFQSDKRFELQNILKIRTLHLMRMTSAVSIYSACMQIRKERRESRRAVMIYGEMRKQLRWGVNAIKMG